jgi:hypothetical protein
LGATLAWYISVATQKNISSLIYNQLNHGASCSMWFLTPLSSQFILKLPIFLSHNYLKLTDQSWLEALGGQGIRNISSKASNTLIISSKSIPVNYLIISILIGAIIFLALT